MVNNSLENTFINDTVDPSLFNILDVNYDNSCLFYSLAYSITFNTNENNIDDISTIQSNWGKLCEVLPELNIDLARYLQTIIVDYITENPLVFIDELQSTIYESIIIIHNITYEEYIEEYRKFAADLIDHDEYDRWGSFLELWVLSQILGLPIIVLNSQRWNSSRQRIENGKIINGNAHRGVRLKITNVIGNQYLSRQPIFLLWKEYNRSGHYMSLLPKNPVTIMEDIKMS